MKENDLSKAFSESISDNLIDYTSELLEIAVDSVLEEGILKNLPFVKTVTSLYNIGNSIKDKHNLRKTEIFIYEINKCIVSEIKRSEYKKKFEDNECFRNQELEYLLILIDRHTNYEKPRMLAKLYIAYLDDMIDWDELTVYAEVIDRLFLVDFNLMVLRESEFPILPNEDFEKILRLSSLGLIEDVTNPSPYESRANGSISLTYTSIKRVQAGIKQYRRTPFGEKLMKIIK